MSVLCNAKWICPIYFTTCDFQVHVPFLVEDTFENKEKTRKDVHGGLKLLVVAKSVPRKNIILVLKALKKLLERDLAISLTLVTEVSTEPHRLYLQEIMSYVEKLQISEHIEILQNIEYSNMANIYRKSDVFILPSFNEPASVSLLEAMVHGCVGISSVQNGTATYISHGDNGFVFDPNDIEALVSLIESLTVSQNYAIIHKNSKHSANLMTSREVFLKHFYDAIC